MCRLLGIVSPPGKGVAGELGDRGCEEFFSLAALHSDGWGAAWISPSGSGVESWRSPLPADTEPAQRSDVTRRPATAALLHLRMASEGMSKNVGNNHPFVADGLAFAHNGFISPVGRLHDLMAAGHVSGSTSLCAEMTDSRLYFELVRRHLTQYRDVSEAVERAVITIRDLYPKASLNAMLLTPDTLIAVHASSHAANPLRTWAEAELPPGHHESYFQMFYRNTHDGGTMVSSSGIDVSEWTPLPAESIVTIDVGTGKAVIRRIRSTHA